ncbi:hypothetical protein ACJ6WF_17295 [Streptomyces sp. MMS24-I2-30]|uniref:hypothetical protein n=1 Tax=unclassified Streptomyces TaxID=2593676 RepID=UPI0036A063AF
MDAHGLGEPFFDVSGETTIDGERGLLGVAFEEKGRGRVSEVVEVNAAGACPADEPAEVTGEVGGVERAAGRGGGDEPAAPPARPDGSTFVLLAFPVTLERVDALGGQGDAALPM